MPVNIHLGGNIHQAQNTQGAVNCNPFEAVGCCLAPQRKCIIRNRPCIGQITKKMIHTIACPAWQDLGVNQRNGPEYGVVHDFVEGENSAVENLKRVLRIDQWFRLGGL